MLDRTARQKEGVKKWVESGCRSSWAWATGVGKTFGAIIAIKLFLSKNKDKVIVVIVPTEYLKIQWLQELSKHQLINYVTVEIINSAIKKNTLIDLIVLDECHKYASNLFYEIFTQRRPKLVLGLSATFHRLDGRHELLNHYCPICDTITVKEAIENKWLSPYVEYKVLIEPNDIDIYKEASRQFQETFAVFDFNFNLAMSCMVDIIKRRIYGKKMGIPAKELDAIVFTWGRSLRARKSFITNHFRKIELTRKILAARPNCKAITFSATIKQAEKIGGGLVVHSGKTKKKNRITMEEFAEMTTGVIHTARSLDEGADCKGLNLAVILSNTSSQTQKIQRTGRILRFEEGKSAEIFNLVIKNTVEENWARTSSAGNDVIEITEEELDDILDFKQIDVVLTEQRAMPDLFRF